MAYLTNRNAPVSGLANLLAMRGRQGDTELVHMSKPEIDMMERMGKMTSNPVTGLPEAFSLEDEISGLASLMEMPSAKDAMKDLMDYGKEKLKTLTMKEIEKEMPAPQQQQIPIEVNGGIGGQQPRPMPFPRPNVIGPAVDRFPIGVQPYQQTKPLGSQDPGRILEIRQNMKDSADVFKKALDRLMSGKSQYEGGVAQLAGGMRPKDYFEGQVYDDRGDGMSDDIGFKVDGDPVIKGAKLSADEYVMPADLVAMLGNGSSDAGAKKLDAFTKEMRMKAFGTTEQQKPINATKELKDMV